MFSVVCSLRVFDFSKYDTIKNIITLNNAIVILEMALATAKPTALSLKLEPMITNKLVASNDPKPHNDIRIVFM